MSNPNKQKWQQWVKLLRSWGITVKEMPNCYNANNGLNWYNGQGPEASLNHHFVCSKNPAQSYIDGLVSMLCHGYSTGSGFLPGPVVNRFVDVNGVVYLIATGPANHAGQGSSVVLSEAKSGRAPKMSAARRGLSDDGVKNYRYVGTETQHPGDSSSYSSALIHALVALNAADCEIWGYGQESIIQHYESTRRKSDMSYAGGPNGIPGAGPSIREQVGNFLAAKHGVTTKPPEDEDDMTLKDKLTLTDYRGRFRKENDYKSPKVTLTVEEFIGNTWEFTKYNAGMLDSLHGSIDKLTAAVNNLAAEIKKDK